MHILFTKSVLFNKNLNYLIIPNEGGLDFDGKETICHFVLSTRFGAYAVMQCIGYCLCKPAFIQLVGEMFTIISGNIYGKQVINK